MGSPPHNPLNHSGNAAAAASQSNGSSPEGIQLDTGNILIIDADDHISDLIVEAVGNRFQVSQFGTGADALANVEECKPDVILLDVELPDKSGYEICRLLRDSSSTANIPIILISPDASLEQRLRGYESGAADYLVKPFKPIEVMPKLDLLENHAAQRAQLDHQARKASDTAMMAMRGSSELGMAIQFIEATYASASYEDIAKRFFEVTNQLDLNCTLLFRTNDDEVTFSSTGNSTPLEEEVIRTLSKREERFLDFGRRTQINYTNISLLIKNMPINDRETYGRYKDFLPTMMGATDANVRAMQTAQAMTEQTKNLNQSFALVQETLLNIGTNLQASQQQVLTLLRSTINELDERIPGLGLEEDQEKYLINTLDSAMQSTHSIIESGESASVAFDTVCRLLDHLSKRQEQLLESVQRDRGDSVANAIGRIDVELF